MVMADFSLELSQIIIPSKHSLHAAAVDATAQLAGISPKHMQVLGHNVTEWVRRICIKNTPSSNSLIGASLHSTPGHMQYCLNNGTKTSKVFMQRSFRPADHIFFPSVNLHPPSSLLKQSLRVLI